MTIRRATARVKAGSQMLLKVTALVWLGAALPISARAQKSSPADARRHVLPAGMLVDAHFERDICEDQLHVGDTVSATVVPARFSYDRPAWWPKRFLVVLRRDAPTATEPRAHVLVFTAVRAEIDGAKMSGTIGEFQPNPEDVHRERGQMEVDCFARGAELNGRLTRRLRVP